MDKTIVINSYTNGNSTVEIYENGTRMVSYEVTLALDYNSNIDISLSTKCTLVYKPTTKTSISTFCNESATTDGSDADLELLKFKLSELPKGIELAIGSNEITPENIDFYKWCKEQGFIINLTINQYHIKRDLSKLQYLISENLIKGLGISLRDPSQYENLPKDIRDYPNSVLHVIAGLDDLEKILKCSAEKILILGYKKFGNGVNFYNSNQKSIEDNLYFWYTNFIRLVSSKKLSFDNLALEQLNVKRWINKSSWDQFYQGEHSMYINAVTKTFSPSSRSSNVTNWEKFSIKAHYKHSQSLKKD